MPVPGVDAEGGREIPVIEPGRKPIRGSRVGFCPLVGSMLVGSMLVGSVAAASIDRPTEREEEPRSVDGRSGIDG